MDDLERKTSKNHSPSFRTHCSPLKGSLLANFLIIFDMNFLHSSQHTAPYLRGCLRVVMELHTKHTNEVVKIEEAFRLGDSSFKENGLLIGVISRAPKDPKLENCSIGFRRIDLLLIASSLFCPFLKSSSSTKLNPKNI